MSIPKISEESGQPSARGQMLNDRKINYFELAVLAQKRLLPLPNLSVLRAIPGFWENTSGYKAFQQIEGFDLILFAYANYLVQTGKQTIEEVLTEWEVPKRDWDWFNEVREHFR